MDKKTVLITIFIGGQPYPNVTVFPFVNAAFKDFAVKWVVL